MTTHTLNTLITRREKAILVIAAFLTAGGLGLTAESWNPYTHTPGQVVDDTATPDPMTTDPRLHDAAPMTIAPCTSDDGSGPRPCYWDAAAQGDGQGTSFTVLPDDTTVYVPFTSMPTEWARNLDLAEDGQDWTTCLLSIGDTTYILCADGTVLSS